MNPSASRVILACCLWVTAALRADSAPFTGAFANGVRFQGAQLTKWPDSQKPPHITVPVPGGSDRDLGSIFDAQNPLSWLFNEAAETPSIVRPGVELVGGDRLPGQVIGFRYGTESPVDRLPAHLLVKPDLEAVKSPFAVLRVKTQAVRKVVWQPRRSDRYTPAILYFLDDRQISFRAVRWSAEGVTLLLPDGGTRTVAFRDIAELHLPRRDPWRDYRETLAVLSPDCTHRLMRVETSRGLTVTGTLELGAADSADTHLLQPAWCLEPVGYAHFNCARGGCLLPRACLLPILAPWCGAGAAAPRWAARLPGKPIRVSNCSRCSHGGKLYELGAWHAVVLRAGNSELTDGIQAFLRSSAWTNRPSAPVAAAAKCSSTPTADKPIWESKLLVGSEGRARGHATPGSDRPPPRVWFRPYPRGGRSRHWSGRPMPIR